MFSLLAKHLNSTSCCVPHARGWQHRHSCRRLCSKQVAAEKELLCYLCHATDAKGLQPLCFQGLEDKGIFLPWETTPAASLGAVPSSSSGMKGSPECTQTEGSSAYEVIWQSVTWGHGHGALPAPLDSLLPYLQFTSDGAAGNSGTDSHFSDLHILPPFF